MSEAARNTSMKTLRKERKKDNTTHDDKKMARAF